MHTQNVTPRWSVSDVFSMIYGNDTPYVFASNFSAASFEEQNYWRNVRDGMGQDLLGHALALGRRQWVQWFLNNGWPVDNQQFSLIQALNRADIGFRKTGLFPVEMKDFVGLSDLMEMMSLEQWKCFCGTLDREDATSLTQAFKNPDPSRHAPPYKVNHFLERLNKLPQKLEVLQQKSHHAISRICQQNMLWFDTFDTFGWDVERLTRIWENPLVDCVNMLLSGNSALLQSAPEILSASWFEKMLCSPRSQKALVDHTHSSVWANILYCTSYPDVAEKIANRLLQGICINDQQVTDLQTSVQYIEQQAGTTPASDVLKSFLSKQIITASLNNSVKSDRLTEKKPFKKM
jgi:hypothetical protein